MLLGGVIVLEQLRIAGQIGLRIGEIGLIPGKARVGLIQHRLKGPGIQLDQEIAGFDLLALPEIDFNDIAYDTALDGHRVECRDGSEAADNDWHIRGGRRRGHDRYGAKRRRCQCGSGGPLPAVVEGDYGGTGTEGNHSAPEDNFG